MILVVVVLMSGCAGVRQDSWTLLFNGQDLAGWEHVGSGRFVVEDGLLKTEGGIGLLWYTDKPFGNAVIRVVYRNTGGANSGVFIRIPEKPHEPWMPVNRGYEVQIDDRADEYHATGALYSLTRVAARPGYADAWNTMEITLDNESTVVTLNGVKVTDYREGQPVPPKKKDWEPDRGPRPVSGYIGLQNHGNEDTVYFREVSVRPLR
jgi:hypothetical protein